jgi:hypothetical protein
MKSSSRGLVSMAFSMLLLALVGAGCGEAESAPLEQRLEDILLDHDAVERARRLTALLKDLDASDTETLRSVYRSLWTYVSPVEAVLFASWWGSVDPEAAMGAIGKGGFAEHAEAALATVLRSWARRDPHAARDYLLENGTSYPQETALLALIRGWAESGDAGAWDFVEAFPKGVPRQRALEVLTDHMVLRAGPEAAVRFVESLPDDGANRFKLQAYRRLAAALVLRDPAYAAAWAERQADSEFGEGVLRHVVGRWAHMDGEATLEWLAGQPPSAAQVEAIELAYSMWLRRHVEKALAWAESQPPMPSLEPVRALYAARISRRDPRLAVSVLDTIEDPERFAWTALNVGRGWLDTDRTAALAWLAEADLDPALREKVLEPPRPRRGRRARVNEGPAETAP